MWFVVSQESVAQNDVLHLQPIICSRFGGSKHCPRGQHWANNNKGEEKKKLSPSKSRIHYSPLVRVRIHLHIRDCACCLCTNTDLHGSFAIPVVSADNPPDAPISFHVIWTFASNFYFWQSTAKGLAMHRWSRRPEMLSTPLSPAVFFFPPYWSVICHVIDSCAQYCRSWFILDLLYAQKRSDWGRLLPLRGLLNTTKKKKKKVPHLTSCRQHDLQLINNVQAANNRILVLWHFRAGGRLTTLCCLHAATAVNVPTSEALKTQSLSVQQQRAVQRLQ